MEDLKRINEIKEKLNKKKSLVVYHPNTDLVSEVKSYFRLTKPNCLISDLTDKEIKTALLANSLTADFF